RVRRRLRPHRGFPPREPQERARPGHRQDARRADRRPRTRTRGDPKARRRPCLRARQRAARRRAPGGRRLRLAVSALSDFLDREIEAGAFPGGTALVGSGTEVLEEASGGSAAVVPSRDPVEPGTLFDLASLTKPLAAGALVAAAPDLDLASSPGRYLPAARRTAWEGITLEGLLTHTSGLPSW